MSEEAVAYVPSIQMPRAVRVQMADSMLLHFGDKVSDEHIADSFGLSCRTVRSRRRRWRQSVAAGRIPDPDHTELAVRARELEAEWAATPPDMTTVYRFYDAEDRLLYVGIAGNPGRRFGQHAADKVWWSQVARSTMQHVPSRDLARTVEQIAIRDEKPLYNIQGRR